MPEGLEDLPGRPDPGTRRPPVDHGCTRKLEALATLLGVYAAFPRASAGIEVIRAELDKLEQQ